MRQYLYIPYFSFLLFYITGAFANPTPHISSSKDTAFYKGEQGGQYIVITTVQRDSTNRISPEKKYPSARSSIRYVDPQGNYVIVIMTEGESWSKIAEITRGVENIMYP